jgi:tRNA(Ile)-lysidine synthase
MAIIDQVRATIRQFGLLKPGETVVIGVSGGPDSLSLLYILAGLQKEFTLSLHAAHLDHNLRTTSGDDLSFVRRQAQALNIPFTGAKAKLRNASEEECRTARLEFLFRVARDNKATTIALGHTLDDQAETVLMRLIRGAGLLGLSGIAPRRSFGACKLIRPLIEVSRAEIEAYLKRKKAHPRIDETNSQDIYLRNRIRKELLPLLEKKYNRNIKQLLNNTAQSAAYDYDCLISLAEKAVPAGATVIALTRYGRLHPALKRMVLRLLAERVQGSMRRLTSRHIREIDDMAMYRPAGSVVNLPKHLCVKKTEKNLRFYLL